MKKYIAFFVLAIIPQIYCMQTEFHHQAIVIQDIANKVCHLMEQAIDTQTLDKWKLLEEHIRRTIAYIPPEIWQSIVSNTFEHNIENSIKLTQYCTQFLETKKNKILNLIKDIPEARDYAKKLKKYFKRKKKLHTHPRAYPEDTIDTSQNAQ